jgi:PKD repeat protein
MPQLIRLLSLCFLVVVAWLASSEDARAVVQPTVTASTPRLSGVPITFDASGSTFPDGRITAYRWDLNSDGAFGEGTDVRVKRAYPPGTHAAQVEVTGQASDGTPQVAYGRLVFDVTNSQPTANFTRRPSTPLTGEPIVLQSTSRDPDGIAPGGESWDLDGDGSFDDATSDTAVTRFGTPGAHVVSLRVQDVYGAVAIRRAVLEIRNRAPAADFGLAPGSPAAGETVEFVSRASDPDGTIARLRWDLDGDDAFDDASGTTAFAAFATPGVHVVRIEATDSDGAVSSAAKTVVVHKAAVGRPAGPARPAFLKPFPVVGIAGHAGPRGATITRLVVTAPRSSWIEVRCRGRGCPAHGVRRVSRRHAAEIRFRRFERLLPAGTRLVIRIGRAGFVGRYVSFRIRANRAPRRTNRCMAPGGLAPVRCERFR